MDGSIIICTYNTVATFAFTIIKALRAVYMDAIRAHNTRPLVFTFVLTIFRGTTIKLGDNLK